MMTLALKPRESSGICELPFLDIFLVILPNGRSFAYIFEFIEGCIVWLCMSKIGISFDFGYNKRITRQTELIKSKLNER